MEDIKNKEQCPIDISDEDIFSAMKGIDGYIDITPSDFKEIYKIAYQHAINRLYQEFKASDIMHRPVIYVLPDTSLLETSVLMAENNISGVPVIDSERCVVGVISEKDFLREMSDQTHRSFMGVVALCLNNKGCVAVSLKNKTAQEIMSLSPVCVQENTIITEIADILEKNNINRVPVLDQQQRLTGIVTRSDLVQHFCTLSE